MGVNQVIETAVGGMNLTQTVEGRERYPIRIRYQRDLRGLLVEVVGIELGHAELHRYGAGD